MRCYAYLLIISLAISLVGCGRIEVDHTDPEAVTQAFIQSQATDNRRALNTLITKELEEKFTADKLYLGERIKLKRPKLLESKIQRAWDEENKKVYQLYYVVQYTADKETKKLSLREAISLVNTDGSWLVEDYVPEK